MTPWEFLCYSEGKPAETIKKEILSILSKRVNIHEQHYDWFKVCEKLGFHDLALKELELAVRDDNQNPKLLLELAERYIERGRYESSAKLILKAKEISPNLTQDSPQHAKIFSLLKTDYLEKDITVSEESFLLIALDESFIIRFLSIFRGREDIYARQWCDEKGKIGYSPVKAPLTPDVIKNHLLGNITVGVYPIRMDNTVRFFAIDLDINKQALEMARTNPEMAQKLRNDLLSASLKIYQELQKINLSPVTEDSGYKGRHFWFFTERFEPADVIFNLGKLLINFLSVYVPPGMHLEFFPKQPELQTSEGVGLGNLIKLPLGIHKKTSRRSVFLDDKGQPINNSVEVLQQIPFISHNLLYEVIENLRVRSQATVIPTKKEIEEIEAPKTTTDVSSISGPPPPPPPPDWTEADFRTHPEISHILKHCNVLKEIIRRVFEHRTLTYNEQIVLIHTLGYIPAGVLAVNYLFSKAGNVPTERYMKSCLSGSPISCPKIRQRIPEITSKVDCSCEFSFATYRYPTPVLHLETLKPQLRQLQDDEIDLEMLARRYAELVRRRNEIEKEITRTSEILVEKISKTPERSIKCPGGKYVVIEKDGITELRWIEDKNGCNENTGSK